MDKLPNCAIKFNTGMMNKNGEKLVQLCSINYLGIMNIMYKHPAKRLYTCSIVGTLELPLPLIKGNEDVGPSKN